MRTPSYNKIGDSKNTLHLGVVASTDVTSFPAPHFLFFGISASVVILNTEEQKWVRAGNEATTHATRRQNKS